LTVEHAYPAYYNPDGTINWEQTEKDYTALLRVTDNSDPALQDMDTCIIHITSPPWKPVADPDGPYYGNINQPITLDASNSYDTESKMYDPSHPWYETIVEYKWDLDNDGQFDDAFGVNPSWAWDSLGTHPIRLRVIDSQPSGSGGDFGPLDMDEAYTTVVISGYQFPIAEFTFNPDKPIISENVKFDASNSYDPDGGVIVNYLWDFGDGNLKYSDTPYIEHRYSFEGNYLVKLRIWDDEGQTSEVTKSINIVTDWSYAIITDLHIGRGYVNYQGEDYYLTERLDSTIQEIIENKEPNNIKFVAVLGDLSEKGTLIELQKSKFLLNRLNDPNGDGNTEDGIPYFPIIGNHDVETSNREPFLSLFNKEFLTNQFKILGIESSKWKNDDDNDSEFFNYVFEFGNINFVCLDFVRGGGLGSIGVLYDETMNWLEEYLYKDYSTIIFSHHPMAYSTWSFHAWDLWNMRNLAEEEDWEDVNANFAGHVHGYYDPSKVSIPTINPRWMNANKEYSDTPNDIPVITTEALMVGSNEKDPKGIIRIVEIESKFIQSEVINYNHIIGEFSAINPYIKLSSTSLYNNILEVEFSIFPFTANHENSRFISLIYMIDFGDGSTGPMTDWGISDLIKKPKKITHSYNDLPDKIYTIKISWVGITIEGKSISESITCKIDNTWRKDILPGDIILHRSSRPLIELYEWTHAGIYVGNDMVVEARPEGIKYYAISDWDYPQDTYVKLLRVFSATTEQRFKAAQWAMQQADRNLPAPIYFPWTSKSYQMNSPSWYCSELVWASYYNNGINLDDNTNELDIITPDEIYRDDDVIIINSHLEKKPTSIGDFLIFMIECPVDLQVTDPDNLIINKLEGQIYESYYIQDDINNDGELEDYILLPEIKEGLYYLEIIPEDWALPTDTYTIKLITSDAVITIVENIQIQYIPKSPYMIKLTESSITPIYPVTVDFDPNTVNLDSQGKWVTAYIELPLGHGFEIGEIDVSSILLNNQIPAETKPIEIGDYDNDGIPDLMVKFSRNELQKILELGDDIEILISGKVNGYNFMGKDIIKVIASEINQIPLIGLLSALLSAFSIVSVSRNSNYIPSILNQFEKNLK
jgi:uncharacterized protein YycO